MSTIGNELTDADVGYYLRKLKRVVKQFADKYDLWHDCGFDSWARYFGEEPEYNPCVLTLHTEGGLCRPGNSAQVDYALDEHFSDVVAGLGFAARIGIIASASFTRKTSR